MGIPKDNDREMEYRHWEQEQREFAAEHKLKFRALGFGVIRLLGEAFDIHISWDREGRTPVETLRLESNGEMLGAGMHMAQSLLAFRMARENNDE